MNYRKIEEESRWCMVNKGKPIIETYLSHKEEFTKNLY